MSSKLQSFISLVLVFYAASSLAITSDLHDLENSLDESRPEQRDITFLGCKKATPSQLAHVNLGNSKAQDFYYKCLASTGNSRWCEQVLRPNPSSISTFQCTYGNSQPHQLINPDENSWPHAIKAVQLVEELESLGIKSCLIYNWWRPEPYNQNVGGAPGRHPFGTSVDVKFCTKPDMEAAFNKLCEWRSMGHIRAVGYYGTNSLHLGIGDNVGNTWGKSCPKLKLSQNL